MAGPSDRASPPPARSGASGAKRSRTVRAARGLAWALLGMVGLVSLVLLFAFSLLHTNWAQKKITAEVDSVVKSAIAGRLSLRALEVHGALSLCLHDVALDDADGVPAIRAKTICVELDALALAHKQVHARSVFLEGPEVFLTRELGADGEPTSSLVRAFSARVPKPEEPAEPSRQPGQIPVSIVADALVIHGGGFEMRDAPGAAPYLVVHQLELGPAKAAYASDGASAKLSLGGMFGLMNDESKVFASVDAELAGGITTGRVWLHALRVQLGQSGFAADGQVDLTALSGALRLRELLIEPKDLDALLGAKTNPLAAQLRGAAAVASDGREAHASVHLQTERGGNINVTAHTTLRSPFVWRAELETEHVDPAFLIRDGPEGRVSLAVEVHGSGLPHFDPDGLEGDVQGTLRVGPAELKATGALSATAGFGLHARSALVKNLEADALAVHVRATGAASLKELALDLDVNATDLSRFARALGALQHKPPAPLSGSAHLTAHLTGSPQSPDAQLHLRAPALALGAGLRVEQLAVDGALQGPLKRPRGKLAIHSKTLQVSGIDLGTPQIVAQVDWPQAHLQIDAAVGNALGDASAQSGALHLAGDAQLDEDGDGAVLSGFAISWPGDELLQRSPTRVHFRASETVVEPLSLTGKRGDLELSATLRPPPLPKKGKPPGPSNLEAQVSLKRFELGSVPTFVLPAGLHLGGSLDAQVSLKGPANRPDIDAALGLHALEIQNVRGLTGELNVRFERERLSAQGMITGVAGARLSLRANVPVDKDAPPDAPVELDLKLGPFDLAQLPPLVQRQEVFLAKPAGSVSIQAMARGTMAHPRAQLIIGASDVAWSKFHALGAHLQLDAEGAQAKLVAQVSVEKVTAATLTAETPFDLAAMLRKPSLFAHAFERPSTAQLRVPDLPLNLLARGGFLPADASGEVDASLDLGGTPAEPRLALQAHGKQLSVGALQRLDLAVKLAAAQKLALTVEATPGGDARAKLSVGAQVSAPELVALVRKGFSRAALDPLLDRALSLQVDFDKLVLGSLAAQAAQASGQAAAQTPLLRGELDGSLTGGGTADAPTLKGNLTLRDVAAGPHQLGDAEVFVEADRTGATVHLGLAPPGANELKAMAEADALARAKAADEAKLHPPDADAGSLAAAPGADGSAPDGGMAARAQAESSAQSGSAPPAAGQASARKGALSAAEQQKSGTEAKRAPSGMTQRGGGTFLGHATLQAPLSARALLDQGADAITEGDLDGSVTMRNLDLTFLSGLTPLLRRTGGVIDGEVDLHGLLGRIEPTGEAHLRGGCFDVVGQGIFDDVSLDATFSPKQVVVERVSGSLGGGTFSAKVTIDRKAASAEDEDDQFQFNGEAHAGDAESVRDRRGPDGKPLVPRPVPLRQAGEVRADLAATVEFSGDDTAGTVTTTIKIPDAKVRVGSLPDKKLPSLSPNPEVLVFRKGDQAPHPAGIDTEELKKQKEAIARSNLRIDAQLELEKLYVSADDFDFPVTSRMHASWDSQHPDQTAADGTIEVKGGTFSALGRRFTIDEAKITETGGDVADPELEIQARYENAQASVLVLVSGSAKDPQIDLSSSPPMDQDAIAFFLATGRLQGKATTQGSSVDLGSAATSVVGALLFGKLRSSMADIMPVDVIDIEAGAGDRPPEAAVGKYIGERVFIGYRQRFSPGPTENETEGSAEYEITRGLAASATVGEKNQGVMVTYTKDF